MNIRNYLDSTHGMKVHGHKKMVFPKAFYTDLNSELAISELNLSSVSYLNQVHIHLSILKRRTIEIAISPPNYLKLA